MCTCSVGDWDAFGAAFPGVPYFMMGYTRDIAWGLTTGFVDCYDVYVEQLKGDEHLTADGWRPLDRREERIDIKGGGHQNIEVVRTPHGPLLESLTAQLGLSEPPGEHATALHWSLADIATSAGALARLPLATSAAEFGHALFEDDVCPLVNNIICVDKNDGLRRFIATTLPARTGATGSVPLAGWEARYDFAASTEEDLTVEIDPDEGYAVTANNDTMGEDGPFYIHNFPAHSSRADRIREVLAEGERFTPDDFAAAQLDLKDLRALDVLPDLLDVLGESEDRAIRLAIELLSAWDGRADVDSAAACVFYPVPGSRVAATLPQTRSGRQVGERYPGWGSRYQPPGHQTLPATIVTLARASGRARGDDPRDDASHRRGCKRLARRRSLTLALW